MATAFIAISAVAAVFVSGCSDTETGETHRPPGPETATADVYLPVPVPEGAQCAECGMYVEVNGRFSGEAFAASGKAVYFCDIGDLLIHLGKADEGETKAAYVRDYNTGGWISAFDATYLADAPVRTPMRFGIAAFTTRSDAEAFRDENGGGTIYTYAGIQAEKPYQ